MDVKNCKMCNRLFNYLSGPRLCPACKAELDKKFDEVKRYIEENRTASIQQVSEAMEVDVSQINQWVREERLIFAPDSLITLDCEGCGAAIRTGRFCEKCKNDMAKGLSNLYKKEESPAKKQERDRARMRFLDN